MFRVDEDVARVHVRVEKIETEYLGKEDLHAPFCQHLGINAGGLDALDIIHRDAMDAIHDDHGRTGQLQMNGRNVQQRAEQEMPAHGFTVAGFGGQIQFAQDNVPIILYHPCGAEVTGIAPQSFQPAGAEGHDFQVPLHHRKNGGAQHLGHYLLAVMQGGGMDLGHGGRGHGRAVKVAEDLIKGLVETGLDQIPGLLSVEGGNLILQAGQGAGPFRWQHVLAGGQQLAELDEDGAETFQGLLQPLAFTELAGAQPAGGQQKGHHQQQVAQRMGGEQGDQAIAAHHMDDHQNAGNGQHQSVALPLVLVPARAVRRRWMRASSRSKSMRSSSTS